MDAGDGPHARRVERLAAGRGDLETGVPEMHRLIAINQHWQDRLGRFGSHFIGGKPITARIDGSGVTLIDGGELDEAAAA